MLTELGYSEFIYRQTKERKLLAEISQAFVSGLYELVHLEDQVPAATVVMWVHRLRTWDRNLKHVFSLL